MDPTKLPDKEAKSLSFLVYSLICLILSSFTSDTTTKIILWIFASISFVLAAAKFIKASLTFPLVPCKNRCSKNGEFVCIRDKGFYLGFFLSIVAVLIIREFQFDFPLEKVPSLFIGIICTMSTIIHGTLRRRFRVLISNNRFDKFLTLIAGFITGIGIFFVAMYFI